jgi:hypothetical protein
VSSGALTAAGAAYSIYTLLLSIAYRPHRRHGFHHDVPDLRHRSLRQFWFCRACRDADARKARGEQPRFIDASSWRGLPDHIPRNWNDISLEALMAHFDRARRRHGAPQRTVEALMFSLRSRGTKALEEAATKRRISELAEQQLHEVCGRLQRLKRHIAPAWPPEQITILVDAWNSCHG